MVLYRIKKQQEIIEYCTFNGWRLSLVKRKDLEKLTKIYEFIGEGETWKYYITK